MISIVVFWYFLKGFEVFIWIFKCVGFWLWFCYVNDVEYEVVRLFYWELFWDLKLEF